MANPFRDDKKPIKYATPVGTAGFVALSAPYTEKDGKELYVCKLRFEGEDADKVVALLDELCALDKSDRKKKTVPPYVYEEDEETGEKTGAVIVSFKALAGGIVKNGPRAGEKWEHRMVIRQKEEGDIGPGSQLAIQFTVNQTEFQKKHYLRLQPTAVKVIELVEFVAGGYDDEGFFGDDFGDDAVEVRPTKKSGKKRDNGAQGAKDDDEPDESDEDDDEDGDEEEDDF